MKNPKLFIPGPTHVPNDILQSMAKIKLAIGLLKFQI